MLNTSAGRIEHHFIVWDNIMSKINEIKNDIENFWSIYVLKSVSFHFLHFRGHQNRAKNLVMTKKLGDKKLVIHCIDFEVLINKKAYEVEISKYRR